MINNDRVVPVEKVDLISLYGLILLQDSNNSGLTALAANNVDGDFTIETDDAILIADQPLKSCDITSDVSAATIYFVPAYDYAGFSLAGVATEASGEVDANGVSLYQAVLADEAITITKIGF